MSVPAEQVFQRIGEEGFARLTAGFYRGVAQDDVLRPMYPAGDMPGAEARLRDFLVQRFGGPPRYSAQRGHPRLRARHVPFRIDRVARDRWVALMERAMDEADLPEDVVATLQPFLGQVATFLVNAPG